MPQMSPMWWETLFTLFIINYIIINTIMFWYSNKNMKHMNKKMMMNNMKWKW